MDEGFHRFEKKWFSKKAFALHIILPWIVISLLSYLIAMSGHNPHLRYQRFLLVLFFSAYFLIVRIAMFNMALNVHEQLKIKYKEQYAQRLGNQKNFGFIALKIGATLARIKRDLAHEDQERGKPTGRL